MQIKVNSISSVEEDHIAASQPDAGSIIAKPPNPLSIHAIEVAKQMESGLETNYQQAEVMKRPAATARVVRFVSVPAVEAASSPARNVYEAEDSMPESDTEDDSSSTTSAVSSPPVEELQTSSQAPLLRLTPTAPKSESDSVSGKVPPAHLLRAHLHLLPVKPITMSTHPKSDQT